MHWIIGLLNNFVAANEAAEVTVGAYQWIADRVGRWSQTQSAETIQKLIEKLAGVPDGEIRDIVAKILSGGKCKISGKQKEEVVAVLVNLSRNARFLTTHGTPRTSYLRCERLLDQLLSDAQPVRKWGEPVAPGHPNWILQRYLGMGSFGEVWLARNSHFPNARAYKFFTRPGSDDWLRREQRNLSQVLTRLGANPHIIEFLDVMVDEGTMPYLAFEYLDGGSLEDWIVEDAPRRSALDKHEIIRGVVSGLAYVWGNPT